RLGPAQAVGEAALELVDDLQLGLGVTDLIGGGRERRGAERRDRDQGGGQQYSGEPSRTHGPVIVDEPYGRRCGDVTARPRSGNGRDGRSRGAGVSGCL